MSLCRVGNQHSIVPRACRGVTLMELMIASTIALVILLAFTGVDAGRIFFTNKVRQDAGFHTEIAYAMSHMVKRLEVADRINRITTANVQFRVPLGNDLDNPANYDWGQYRYDAATEQLFFYNQTEDGCTAYSLATNVTAATIDYADVGPAPPGGEPLTGEDNNVLTIEVSSQDPVTQNTLVFRGDVTIRAAAYTNVSTGLSGAGVLDPPVACT